MAGKAIRRERLDDASPALATPRAEQPTAVIPWRAMAGRRRDWDTLARNATEPNPFFESWYLLPSQRMLDPSCEARLLVHQTDGELTGLMPVSYQKRYYGWPVPHLRNWVHANCFVGTPLVATGHEHAFWTDLLAWGDRNAGNALFLHLGHIPLDGPLFEALLETVGREKRPCAVVHREERALLSAGQTPEEYFTASLSGKKRKELRRQMARLSELGEVRFERTMGAQGLDRWREDFLSLEARGWKGKAGSALACEAATAKLFRDALIGAAESGRLERLSLTLDDKPLAMLANFVTPPGAFSFKTAFDEDFARFSPGVLLQCENLLTLDRDDIAWTDSCASADHPMIDHIWRERRAIGRISIGIGGRVRQAAFRRLLRAELRRNPAGVDA